ncbi:MAG: hemerythrin domain-containing protein [Proteobacteria bacterium]|nr:hemerythrin domain-containing protein [Pseudomonadota bacterium]MDA1022590.1 hemerythrin domain-containing protein [Pseudomonadota bacterium]
MTDAIEIIQRDHVNLDRVLNVLETAVGGLAPDQSKPDLELLFLTVYYIRVFPDRFHHPKEEQYLFPALRARCPQAADLIDRLDGQHAQCAGLIDALDAALKAVDADYPAGLEELRAAVRAYVDFQRDHIGLEERELIPLARNHLEAADWGAINRAFSTDSDPMFGENMETGFRALFEKITR